MSKAVINKLKLIPADPLYLGNREAFFLVNEGFDLPRDDANKIALHINYIDFETPENNRYKVVNQYSVQGERCAAQICRFINGIPVVIFEFKSAIREDATLYDAWEQINTRYRRDIP